MILLTAIITPNEISEKLSFNFILLVLEEFSKDPGVFVVDVSEVDVVELFEIKVFRYNIKVR